MRNLPGYLLVILFAIGAAKFLGATQKKEARVTQVVRDVRVLASNTAARAATVNERVVEGNAVRTGGDSRAELTFPDTTLTRLGANTIFSFGERAREFNLSTGAMLLAVPKSSGTVHVNTAAATAAVTGFTGMWENTSVHKLIVLEGDARISFKNFPNNPCRVEGGQMIVWPDHPTRCPEVHTVDVGKLVRTAKLIKQKRLPQWSVDAIQLVIDSQAGLELEEYTDLTGHDNVDHKNAGEPRFSPPRISHPDRSPPGR